MLKHLRPLLPYIRRYQRRYVLGFLTLLIAQSVGVLVPLVIKAGVDDLTRGVPPRRLLFVVGLLLALASTKAVFQFWMRWILIGISRDAEYDLRNDLFRHLTRLSPQYYTENRTGDLMSKLTNDLNAVRNMVGPGHLEIRPIFYDAAFQGIMSGQPLCGGTMRSGVTATLQEADPARHRPAGPRTPGSMKC